MEDYPAIVQVLNISNDRDKPTLKDFKKSFKLWKKLTLPLLVPDTIVIGELEIVSLIVDENFYIDSCTKKFKCVTECFLQFAKVEDAQFVIDYALNFELYHHHKHTQNSHSIVDFIKPRHTTTTRTMLRQIGSKIARLNDIDTEISSLGVVKYGHPILHNRFQDKQEYAKRLTQIKGDRAMGLTCKLEAYHDLRTIKPVDIAAKQAQLQALYDEKCDVLIFLREIQLSMLDCETEMIDFEFETLL